MLYELKNISKIYKSASGLNHAIDDISLTLNSGEIIVILGPSGSGKSTLLNLLSGIDSPSKGKIIFEGERLDKKSEIELSEYRRENLGFIFQNYNLISNLTVKENVELGSHLTCKKIDIDEVLSLVGLNEHKNKYPYQLSGGQMQRVAIARAIVKNPKVMFCDEPTGALDEQMGKNVLKLLQDMNKKYKTTMIIVTHNPGVADMANTVIRMNSGTIVEIKKNKKVKKAENLRWA
jgi:putative ABC transport system ATP-binding protein